MHTNNLAASGISDRHAEKATLFVMAFLLAGIERFIPTIPVLPWLKLGLFHAIVMIWIFRFGLIDALAFIFIRQWVIMAFFGFSLLPFVLGFSGSITSVIIAAALIKTQKFGIIAIAISAAFIHNITQLWTLYVIMDGAFFWQWQLPIMFFASIFTGIFTGFLAWKISKLSFNSVGADLCVCPSHYANLGQAKRSFVQTNPAPTVKYNVFGIFALVCIITATLIWQNYIFYAALFAAIIIIAKLTKVELLAPVKFAKRYSIFIFALFLSSVFYNLESAVMHTLKIILWFLLTPFFQKYGFYLVFYSILSKIFPKKCSQTLSIGAIMPQIFANVLEEVPNIAKTVFKNPKQLLPILMQKTEKILTSWA